MITATRAAGLVLSCLGMTCAAGGAALARTAAPSGVPSGAVTPADVARMHRSVERLVSEGHFMGSVLVAERGQILFDKGYGSADLELNVPDSARTKFLLGSVTKQFTAAAILLLQQRGKLKITDHVRDYLVDAPADWDQITFFNLLTHTSGIPSYSNFPDFNATKALPSTPEQLVDRFRGKPLDFAPGTAWRYSNSGYALLGYLIERISGEPYGRFIQQNIFNPLGMRDSGYGSNSAIIARRAHGYTPGPDGAPINADYIDMSVPYAAGGLYSTSADLLRWEQALYGGKLLSAASLRQMTTPFMDDYALGLMVRAAPDGEKILTHGGSIYGFNCEISYVPARGLAVIVLANLNGPAAHLIDQQLLEAGLHQRLQPASIAPRSSAPAVTPDAALPPQPLSN
ncbi:MAG: serine hydrolase domain-containing protein [Steroidobacteraceae bacterium]